MLEEVVMITEVPGDFGGLIPMEVWHWEDELDDVGNRWEKGQSVWHNKVFCLKLKIVYY